MRIFLLLFFIFFSYCLQASPTVAPNSSEVITARTIFNRPFFIQNEPLKSYEFDLAIFKQKVSFNEIVVNNLSLNWVDFMGPVTLYRLKINEDGNFYFTHFHNTFEMSKVICINKCIFYYNVFNDVEITNSKFKQPVSFQGSVFIQNANLENSEFDNIANFSQITANKNLNFNNSFFVKEFNLSQSIIKGYITVNGTQLPPYVNLSNVRLDYPLNLKEMSLSGLNYIIHINLLRTDVNKIEFDYSYFRLSFPPDTAINEIENTYLALLTKFKNQRDMKSYNRLLAEYSEYINLYKKKYVKNIISKYWWNYGTNPEWIFFWIGMILLFFTIINAIFYEKITLLYLDIPFLKEDQRHFIVRNHPIIRFIYFFPGALLFTIIMLFGSQFRVGISLFAFKTNSVLINIYFFILILSGLICLFFLFKYIVAQIG